MASSRLPKSLCGPTIMWKSKPRSSISCWGAGEGACSLSYLWLFLFGANKPLLLTFSKAVIREDFLWPPKLRYICYPNNTSISGLAVLQAETLLAHTRQTVQYLIEGSQNKNTKEEFPLFYCGHWESDLKNFFQRDSFILNLSVCCLELALLIGHTLNYDLTWLAFLRAECGIS